MSLIAYPPKLPHTDIDMDMFLQSGPDDPIRRFKRTLPAEWFPQSGIQLTWPHKDTDWAYMLQDITECYIRMAYEIATRERLIIVTPDVKSVQSLLNERLPRRATDNIVYMECPTDDTWARDHAFLTVVGSSGAELLDFRFNGWGGKFEARQDNAINRHLYESGLVKGQYVDLNDFELEGGSIESDGMGTILTTTSCVLNENRNNGDAIGISTRLTELLGAEQILWLRHGHLEGDDTDGHIDTLARFCPDNHIAYVKCEDHSDEHYEDLRLMEEELMAFRTLRGTPYQLVPLPLPDAIYDEEGQRLPATYANFLIMNHAILLPTYRQTENDERAKKALQRLFPKYDVVGIDAVPLIQQHGSIHCATMQYPKTVIPT
ncbi:MAG: agmatine deiminase family protein [Bacteroidaceae bacterium]|nr:agmatine deiminase family protein [Bacteroidaceae bacterium]